MGRGERGSGKGLGRNCDERGDKARVALPANDGIRHRARIEFCFAEIKETLAFFRLGIDAQAIVDKGQVDIEQQIEVGIASEGIEPRIALISRVVRKHHFGPHRSDQWVSVEQDNMPLTRGGGAVHGVLCLRDMH